MMPPPSLGSIPPEVIVQIAESLPTKDLNSLVQVSLQFQSLLSSHLYALGASWMSDLEEDEAITPLAWCVRNGHRAVAVKLLLKNANPFLAAGGTTAVHEAVEQDYVDELQLMLDRPYDNKDLKNDLNETPLMTAARLGREACARTLLGCGVRGDLYSALRVAVGKSQESIVRLILSSIPAGFKFQDNELHSFLLRAVSIGHAGILRQLLSFAVVANSGFDVNSAAYVHIPYANDVACIDPFFEYGADINFRAELDWTFLHCAVSARNYEAVVHLIGMGADVNAVDIGGGTPLQYASSTCPAEGTIKCLLEAGADLSATDSDGETSLHSAIRAGNTNIAQILIAAGAPLNVADHSFKTPLQYAVDKNDMRVIQLLVEELQKEESALGIPNPLINWFPKQHVDGTTTYWNAGSALHDAVANGQEQVAELLLSKQRDIHFQDLYGRTALDWTPAHILTLRHKILQHWGNRPQDPDPTQQSKTLKRSITILANNLLLSLSIPTQNKTVFRHHLYTLGKCLLYLDNEEAARTAFALQGDHHDHRAAKYAYVTCNRCRQCPTVDRGWWICKTCPQIDLCDVCARHYADFLSVGGACVAHQMLQVKKEDQEGLEIGQDGELSVGKDWLQGLVVLYST
ncbi:ankyrin repeat-containing domain protein [Aspergillus granulosus]|uniref:Ankyrin repeat-containing domain protein n=1 Tax=Aspergillus granulosus TaxID=176169 RepID=A0ABR4I1J2_9EURO